MRRPGFVCCCMTVWFQCFPAERLPTPSVNETGPGILRRRSQPQDWSCRECDAVVAGPDMLLVSSCPAQVHHRPSPLEQRTRKK